MRLDKYLSEKFGSRTKAAQAIEKGLVLVNGRVKKPSDEIKDGDAVTFLEAEEQFVSNGGYKLSKALRDFNASVAGCVVADVGASTGGFTDCLLKNGAKRVYAIDVGESLLDESLKNRAEIVLMERTNARYLKKSDFGEKIDVVTADVSFISLKYILPSVADILDEGDAYLLIKPQFECNGKNIGKSGIVKDRSVHKKIVSDLYDFALGLGLAPQGMTNAPVREKKNVEYVIWLKKNGVAVLKDKILTVIENLT